jgi:hypothetical protein
MAIGPSVHLGASLSEGLLHEDRTDPPEGVCPLQPCALIDGVIATQLRGGRSHAVVSACMRGERSARRGSLTLWVTAVSVRSMSTTDTCQIASRKTGRFS